MFKPKLSLQTEEIQDNIPTEVIPGLYIGSIHSAFNQEALNNIGITHILNASCLPATFPKQYIYLTIDIRDKEGSNLLSCIPAANVFIDSGRKLNRKILVHCLGGRSRSTAFVIAYLMSLEKLPFEIAYERVKNVRSVIKINHGFQKQLLYYGAIGFDIYKAHQLMLRDRLMTLGAIRNISQTRNTINEIQVENNNNNDNNNRNSKRRKHDNNNNENNNNNNNNNNIKINLNNNNQNNDLLNHKFDVTLPSPREICQQIQTPMIRYSSPDSNAMQVIPPLRSHHRIYCCKNCGHQLFTLGSVLNLFIEIPSSLPPSPIMMDNNSMNIDNDIDNNNENKNNNNDEDSEARNISGFPSMNSEMMNLDENNSLNESSQNKKKKKLSLSESKSLNSGLFPTYIDNGNSDENINISKDDNNLHLPNIRNTPNRISTPPIRNEEKVKWLAKFSLIDSNNSITATKISEQDYTASRLPIVNTKWLYLEYFDWMGHIINYNQGYIHCPNLDCKNILGEWSWKPEYLTNDLPNFQFFQGSHIQEKLIDEIENLLELDNHNLNLKNNNPFILPPLFRIDVRTITPDTNQFSDT